MFSLSKNSYEREREEKRKTVRLSANDKLIIKNKKNRI